MITIWILIKKTMKHKNKNNNNDDDMQSHTEKKSLSEDQQTAAPR